MDFTKPVNAYCERLAHGLWQEPVNLFSNAFFLICGIILISKGKCLVSTCRYYSNWSTSLSIYLLFHPKSTAFEFNGCH
jgi:hypothetical protein